MTTTKSYVTRSPFLYEQRQIQEFGNGTTALFAALHAVECYDCYVAIPAPVCPSVVAAVLASGNRPWFIDIELERLGISPASLEAVIDKVGAVIAVHSYGIPCKIVDIRQICYIHSVPLIEDCAQAEGATYQGCSVGNFGDIAVFSYGAGKIISVGGGGSANAVEPALMTKLRLEHQALPGASDKQASSELGHIYKFFYNNFYPDGLRNYRFIFSPLMRDFGLRLLARYDSTFDDAIAHGKSNLNENIANRKYKASLYRELLGENKAIKILDQPDGSVPWRFNIWLSNQQRDIVLRTMLAEGYNISSWYPDISIFFDDSTFRSTDLPNSVWLSSGILNLWLDDKTTKNDIQDTCLRFLSFVGKS